MADSDKFKNKYRVKSHRHPDWDYRDPGGYFITICTVRRKLWLGQVIDGSMNLSRAGEIVQEEIVNTAVLRPNIKIDPWCVMPNHIHFVLWIQANTAANYNFTLNNQADAVESELKRITHALQKWKADSVGSIVNQIKGKCTRRIRRETALNFSWQPNYYDHILRNEDEQKLICEYILNNPLTWEADRMFQEDKV